MDVIIDVQNTDVIHAVFTYGVRIDFKFHQTLHTQPTMISIEIHILVRRIVVVFEKQQRVSIALVGETHLQTIFSCVWEK